MVWPLVIIETPCVVVPQTPFWSVLCTTALPSFCITNVAPGLCVALTYNGLPSLLYTTRFPSPPMIV
jgi:hypothetical protein